MNAPTPETAVAVTFTEATAAEALEIATLETAVAEQMNRDFGPGHWSLRTTERAVLHALRTARVFVARTGPDLVATLRLATQKPWAIDKSFFHESRRPLYLTAMAVAPGLQRRGIGRALLAEARRIARDWPGDALRLDAYDDPCGAGEFYTKCGFEEVGRATYRGTPLIYYELLL